MAPGYIIKDFFGVNILFIFFAYLIFFVPNWLGHPDNYIISNQLVTPIHIVPEWYFSPLYAILRSVPDKLFGIIVLVIAICCLLIIPIIYGYGNIIRSFFFKPFLKILMVIFIINCYFLGWIGGMPVIEPYFTIGQISTIMYFVIIFFIGFIGFSEQFSYKSYLWKDI